MALASPQAAPALAPTHVAAARPDFAAAYRQYYGPICAYLQRMLGNPDDADDLALSTFEKAYRHWDQAPPERLAPWLYRIATNTCLDTLRRRKLIRWQPLDAITGMFRHPAATEQPEREVLRGEQQALVRQALKQLLPRQRAALLLRECQELSCAEIGESLGVSAAGAKQLLFRARQQLRARYLELGGDPTDG